MSRGEATHGDCELKLIYNVKQTAYTARVHVHFVYMYIHVHEFTYGVVFFAACSIAGYLPGNQHDQQIRNCY